MGKLMILGTVNVVLAIKRLIEQTRAKVYTYKGNLQDVNA